MTSQHIAYWAERSLAVSVGLLERSKQALQLSNDIPGKSAWDDKCVYL